MKGFSPRERNGIIALACVVLLCLAVGPIVSLSGCSGKDAQKESAEAKTLVTRADTTGNGNSTKVTPASGKSEHETENDTVRSRKSDEKSGKSRGKVSGKDKYKSSSKKNSKKSKESGGAKAGRRSLRDEKFE